MAKMTRVHFTFWIFLMLLAFQPQMTRAQECAAGVDDCVTTVFGVVGANPDDIELICRSTDEFLACIVDATRTCDPVVSASVKEGISPMIDLYTAEPYNCVLVNAENEQLKHDNCSEEMSLCGVFFVQAESEPRYGVACSLFEDYLSCMTHNTSSCGPELRPFITDHSRNATAEFDEFPYYCEERLIYDIEKVEEDMIGCMSILNNLNTQIIKQDYVCGVYRSFMDCAIEALAGASPRQFDLYVQQVNLASMAFTVRPYFCEESDPCMALFKSCNDSAYYPQMAPCELMDVYTSCMANSLSVCTEADYTRVALNVQAMMGEIYNMHNCIEMVTTEITTTAKSTSPTANEDPRENPSPASSAALTAQPINDAVTERQSESNQSGNVDEGGDTRSQPVEESPSQPQENTDQSGKDNAGTLTYHKLAIVAGSILALLLP